MTFYEKLDNQLHTQVVYWIRNSSQLKEDKMTSQDKLKEFGKRLLGHAVAQLVPGSFQLAFDVAQDFYEIFITADDQDRQILIEAAQNLSPQDRQSLIDEIRQSHGDEGANALNGVVETLRLSPSTQSVAQTLNHHLLRDTGRTLVPRPLSAQQRAIGAAVSSTMIHGQNQMVPRQRGTHPSQ